ncbi:hypothetical protein [Streptomyces sp. ISL-86]|uniref:hypothetical protein n=1 Tax=Streptomyces sp. ISL-86 TaxID=2819187 RepID=UPI001BE790C5|nr:hypothetical protein [Streptomyces sp. ISL-86]MBT2459997.1 hypothetical protein [Streptomyces sp. ISL-86]
MARRELEFPVLREKELVRAGVDVAALRRITVVLGRPGGGKWHVPASGSSWRGHCRYAEHLTGSPLVLLDVVEQVCRHCAPLVPVEPGWKALWLAAAEVIAADVRVRRLEEQETEPRSWDGYARVLWEAARHSDADVRGLLEPWTADRALGAGARQMLEAWTGVLERSETALGTWRAAAPAARAATSVSGACNAVAADGQIQQQGQQLAAAVVDRSRWADPFDVWAAVRRAWSVARDQGGGEPEARAAAMKAVGARWGGAPVRDVSVLAEPALLTGAGFSSPAQWADAEFRTRWERYVQECCDRLEKALRASGGDDSEAGRQLLLVTGWPLVRQHDVELSYLAQFEQHGPAVPFGGRRTGYGWEPDHAVVLAVPRFAGEHAVKHTRGEAGRVVLGPEAPAEGTDPSMKDVLELLRGAYPYLPADAELDVPKSEPTPLVKEARAERRSAQRPGRDYGEFGSIARYNDLVVGAYIWVPDDDHPGTAATELAELPVHWLKDWTLWMDVECGERQVTTLHRLYGTVTFFEADSGQVGFCPTGGHPPISVPVHRIVALAGDRQRRGPGQVPAHEPLNEN